MIKKIIKHLNENVEVTDWLIKEVKIESSEAFYVLQHLETTRKADTLEYTVTVYHKFQENDKEYLGSSSFNVNHKCSASELKKMIDEAVYSSKFIKNRTYEIVIGEKKKSWKERDYEDEPFALLDKIANIFFSKATKNSKFNSLELFHKKVTHHIVNSKNVDLKNTLNSVEIEAIPSYDGEDLKVELYKFYTYKKVDFDVLNEAATTALQEVEYRYNAKKIEDINNIDVILQDKDVAMLFHELIANYSYAGIYKEVTDKRIGDMIQKDASGDLLTIGLNSTSKADAFDSDGVLLQPVTIIENGKLVNYYGDNQYANYLNIKPTGRLSSVTVNKGKKASSKLMAKPHIKVIALSNIQIEVFSSYIGGEVRLAIYFDGKDYIPVSGFSFSGNLDKCLNDLLLSKETFTIPEYIGPKLVKLSKMDLI